MNLFSLMAEISVDNKEYNSKIDESAKKTENVATKMGSSIKKGAKIMTGAFVTAGVASTKVGMDFEASMDQVAATMGIVGDYGDEQFSKLAKAAKEMGSNTKYSASESAEALNYLALAGYDTDKAISALPKVLNLAQAGGLDLAYASDLATDSMSALGLETDELETFTNQLAKTSQKANTNVAQLGEGILTVGGTAKVLKGGTVELNTQLGILADNGIKGAEGGTLLRNVILSLGSPTDKAGKLMKNLGLEVYDASGKMRSTNEIFKDLDKILGTMTEQEKTKVLSELFNKVDLKGVNALLANSGERFDELSAAIANSDNAASDMAKTMDDNLKGKITGLMSKLEGLGTAFYEKIQEPLKKVVEFAQEGIGKVIEALESGKFDWWLDKIGLGLSSVLGYMVAMKGVEIVSSIFSFGKALFTTAKRVKTLSKEMGILNFVMSLNPIGVIIGLIGALAGAFIYLWNTSEEFRDFWINLWEVVKENCVKAWKSIKGFFTETIPNIIQNIEEWFNGLKEYFSEMWETVKTSFVEAWNAISDFFTETIPNIVESIKEWFNNLPEFFLQIWENVKSYCVEKWGDIKNFFSETIPAIINHVWENFNNLPHLLGLALGTALGTVMKWGIDTWNYLAENVPLWIDAVFNWFKELPGKIWSALYEAYTKVVEWGTETYNKAVEIASQFVEGFVNWISQLPERVWSWLVEVFNKVATWGTQMYNKAVEIGSTFVNNIINWVSQLPGRVWSWLSNTLSKAGQFATDLGRKGMEAGRNLFNGIVDIAKSIPGQMVTIGRNIVEGVWNGIIGAKDWLMGKVRGFFRGIVEGAKSALGIHSPSRVFRDEVGVFMAQGVGVGFENEMADINKDIERQLLKTTDIDFSNNISPISYIEENNNANETLNKMLLTLQKILNKEQVITTEDGRELMRFLSPYQNEFAEYNRMTSLAFR